VTTLSQLTVFIMIDFNTLSEFSRNHCIAICAFLVPANLLITLLTLILTAFNRPRTEIIRSAVFSYLPATVMLLHVLTWFNVGVVMMPTYILTGLALTCLTLNTWAAINSESLRQLAIRPVKKITIAINTLFV
jgi:hypothetical protein